MLLQQFLQPVEAAVTHKGVAGDPDVLQAGEVGRHVLQGGQLVVADVQALQGLQLQGRRVYVDQTGVV